MDKNEVNTSIGSRNLTLCLSSSLTRKKHIINDLPEHVLLKTFSYIPNRENIDQLRLVCKKWLRMIDKDTIQLPRHEISIHRGIWRGCKLLYRIRVDYQRNGQDRTIWLNFNRYGFSNWEEERIFRATRIDYLLFDIRSIKMFKAELKVLSELGCDRMNVRYWALDYTPFVHENAGLIVNAINHYAIVSEFSLDVNIDDMIPFREFLSSKSAKDMARFAANKKFTIPVILPSDDRKHLSNEVFTAFKEFVMGKGPDIQLFPDSLHLVPADLDDGPNEDINYEIIFAISLAFRQSTFPERFFKEIDIRLTGIDIDLLVKVGFRVHYENEDEVFYRLRHSKFGYALETSTLYGYGLEALPKKLKLIEFQVDKE